MLLLLLQLPQLLPGRRPQFVEAKATIFERSQRGYLQLETSTSRWCQEQQQQQCLSTAQHHLGVVLDLWSREMLLWYPTNISCCH